MFKNKRTMAVEAPLKLSLIIGDFFSAIDEDFENTDVRKMTDVELREMFLIYVRDLTAWTSYQKRVLTRGEAVADSVVSLVRKVFGK